LLDESFTEIFTGVISTCRNVLCIAFLHVKKAENAFAGGALLSRTFRVHVILFVDFFPGFVSHQRYDEELLSERVL
jgi:hypothetical protein